MTKLKFNHMLALASTMALMSGSQTVYAQTQPAATETEEVVVTGFRRSIENSLNAKRESASVVEAVYAEDIGKLPDSSIAESLARLPGLGGERRDGRTSGISVRGFNENYIATTMNGRELLGIGDNRGVEYDLYPSEILAGVEVAKTPDATMITQGLGGVVELKTTRPLNTDRIIAVTGSYEQNGLKSANPDMDDNGYRVAGTFSDKFADDTIGLALSVASMESPSQEEQFRAWEDGGTGAWPLTGVGGQQVHVLGGHDSYVRSSMMERDTIAGVVQWAPTDQITLTVDALDIDFLETKVFRGLEEAVHWGAPNNSYSNVVDGLATAGATSGFHSVIRNDAEEKDADLTTYGVNFEYKINDVWTVALDYSTGESSKDLINMESYSGVGRGGMGGRPANDRTWELTSKGVRFTDGANQPDYSDFNNIYLAGPQTWGGGIAPIFDGRNDQQDGFVNNPYFEEELDSFRVDVKAEFEFAIINGVEFGINSSDRSKMKINNGVYLTSPAYFTSAGLQHDPLVDGPYDQDTDIDGGQELIPAQYRVGTTDLGFLGLGEMVAYDSLSLYKSGYYVPTYAAAYQTDRLGDTYQIDEEVLTAYVMANIEAGIVTGNVGVQFTDTDQTGYGFDTATGQDGFVVATPVEDGASYTNVLPSLNLSAQVTDELVVRLAAAKTASRARMDQMKPNNTIGFNFDTAHRESSDPGFSAWSGSAGNARLKPIEANQYDTSVEYYFADDGFVSAAYFYKDIVNWHVNQSTLTDFTPNFVEGYHDAGVEDTFASFQGYTNKRVEAGDGYAKGWELQASVPFHIFAEALDGLGVIASITRLDGELRLGDNVDRIPGLSEEIEQLTVYFEKAGFEARVSGRKRDSFATEFPGLSLALTPTVDQGAELWDAQIGYNFDESGIDALEGLNVTLQAQNLTDEDTALVAGNDSRQKIKYQHFGSNYLLGVNYKF